MGSLNGGGTARKGPIYLSSGECTVVLKPELKKVAAYSNEIGEWSTFDVPAGVKATPLISSNLAALGFEGQDLTKLAVYLPATGKWYPTELKAPYQGKALPIVSTGMACYTLGRRVYAFSAAAAHWDVLELPEGAEPKPTVSPKQIFVQNGDHFYIFSAKTGKWSDFDAGDSKEK